MKRHTARIFIVMLAALFLGITVFELTAEARSGGGRSSGSRGSRTYTKPAAPSSQPNQQRQQQQAAPAPNQMQQQPMGGSFMRSMAGGLMGGLIGSMLFSSFAGASGGMGGGGGIGLFEIILLAGIGYLIFRFIKKKKAESQSVSGFQPDIASSTTYGQVQADPMMIADPVNTGLDHIRQMDAGFDPARFSETAMDIFFKIQAGWMNRDLSKVAGLLTDEMRTILQGDVDELLRNKRINRLENIAVRNVELAEVWQESGQDFITTLIHANLLDYTTDEAGTVLEGSTTDPVVFKEFWTFSRPVGNNSWQLSAIQQS
jgi:predicted lipid-binding transport protein (Tim44 family)